MVSLITGAVLSAMHLTAESVLAHIGLTPERLELFQRGVVAGVPPDYYSSSGQLCSPASVENSSGTVTRTSSTTAACSWFSSRIGAVQPSR